MDSPSTYGRPILEEGDLLPAACKLKGCCYAPIPPPTTRTIRSFSSCPLFVLITIGYYNLLALCDLS
jgi:hypothetical protein